MLLVNPIGTGRGGQLLPSATNAVALGAGAVAGGVAGAEVSRLTANTLNSIVPDALGVAKQYVVGALTFAVHAAAAYALGFATKRFETSNESALTNARIGAQATIIATGAMPLINAFTGLESNAPAIATTAQVGSNFISTDFKGQLPLLPSLERTVGSSYFRPVGGEFGQSGTPAITVGRDLTSQFAASNLAADVSGNFYF